MELYPPEKEQNMRNFHAGLNERDRRLYAGMEALHFGHGGIIYIAKVLGCSRNTVRKGAQEIGELSGRAVHEITRPTNPARIRKPGGGRPSMKKTWGPELDEKLLQVLQEHTAGDPMDGEIRWTYLTLAEIAEHLAQDHKIRLSRSSIRKLLKRNGYRRRKAQKRKTMKNEIPYRNEQFENIARLKSEYETAGNPIISMDTKKKEHIGNFYRDGRLYTNGEIKTYDHDFKSFSSGVIIPHGIYDLQRNTGYLQLGTSYDTSEFACDSLRYWWNTYGQQHYPNASSILILCDGGGSNSANQYLFKRDLQQLANEIGVEIRIAHYPPYCSKYNPIEHRLFPHVTRACQGVIFKSVDLVKTLMERASTQTGLKTFVTILDKIYLKGRKVSENFKKNVPIIFDALLPKWNYRVIPVT